MKNKLLKISMFFILVTAISFSAWAGEPTYEGNKLAGNIRAISHKQSRGQVISTGILQISNPEDGTIGVYMQTLTHIDVDKSSFMIYLDKWVENESKWVNVEKYSFDYTKEDEPDGDLTMKDVFFYVKGQPMNCYYRLRGIHIVSVGGSRETLSTQTDGILITK